MSSSSMMVPAEGAVISSLLHQPLSALSEELCLPHPSCEYALTYSTLHELEGTSNNHLFKPTFDQVGQVSQNRSLVKVDR